MKLWAGRFHKELDQKTNDFNSSIAFDSRMAQEDITGSMAHAAMLAKQGIISAADGEAIRDGLAAIAADLRSGALTIDPNAEDIHTFVEGELTARIGDAGKRLHTGRSRNDQVALDIRLYLKTRSRRCGRSWWSWSACCASKPTAGQTRSCRATLICSGRSPSPLGTI